MVRHRECGPPVVPWEGVSPAARVSGYAQHLRPSGRTFPTHSRKVNWRRRPESNWGWRFCRPLPCHLATSPRPSSPDSTVGAANPRPRPTTLAGELEPDDFRDVMARLAASVVVISAPFGDGFRGLTATSLVSISTEPPMGLVTLERLTGPRN